jgi:hypothetical protein
VNNFAVLQFHSGKLEIVELPKGTDPVELARNRNAFLLGITESRSRAEFVLRTEINKRRGCFRS